MPVECDHHCVGLAGVVSDPVDGATRLLTDVAKLGLAVRELHVLQGDCGSASIQMTLVVPSELDVANVCSRFRRHVTVISLKLA